LLRLLKAYAELFQPPQRVEAKVDPATPLITAVSLDEEVAPLAQETLEAWRQQLKALAQRFRLNPKRMVRG